MPPHDRRAGRCATASKHLVLSGTARRALVQIDETRHARVVTCVCARVCPCMRAAARYMFACATRKPTSACTDGRASWYAVGVAVGAGLGVTVGMWGCGWDKMIRVYFYSVVITAIYRPDLVALTDTSHDGLTCAVVGNLFSCAQADPNSHI